MPRIPLPTRDDLKTDEERTRWDAFSRGGPMINIMRLYFANPLLESQGRRLWRASGLDDRRRELVILRAAFRKQSKYEWHQHVRFSRRDGMPDADIRAVGNWQASDRFSDDERALLAYVDAIVDTGRPDDELYASVHQGRSDADMLGITCLIAHYLGLGNVMSALDLETEEPFVGWEL
ncbi:hypothetical protein AYO38_00915 [bacterium SCGC AG-212-C10]|nr:hypothetical protein AYO38_00915 [bacterium SCGC AG-212-C10]